MRLFIALCSLWLVGHASCDDYGANVIGYYESWAVDREGKGKYGVSDIDPTLFTHLIYALLNVDDSGSVRVLREARDLSVKGGYGGIEKFVALRDKSPETKFMISVGPWERGSPNYLNVVRTPETRSNFVQSIVDLIIQYDLDGLDIYWVYPSKQDKEKFVLLLRELRAIFDELDLILSATLVAVEDYAKETYDIPATVEYLDFVSISYEYHGVQDKVTGESFALEPSHRDTTRHDMTLNIEASVKFWVAQGFPTEKLHLVIPFYGNCYTLENPALNTPGSPIKGLGNAGKYTKMRGRLAYFEIAEHIVHDGWTPVWDSEQDTVYAYGGDQWCSYTNDWSLPWVTDLLKRYCLGGATLWSIDQDDFRGIIGHKNALLEQANRQLRNPDL